MIYYHAAEQRKRPSCFKGKNEPQHNYTFHIHGTSRVSLHCLVALPPLAYK